MAAVDWLKVKMKVKLGNHAVTVQCGKKQAATTLCRFQSGVSDAGLCAVYLLLLPYSVVSRVLCAKAVGATSSEGFLVRRVFRRSCIL